MQTRTAFVSLAAFFAAAPCLAQHCAPEWAVGNFGNPGALQGSNPGIINNLVRHDDGGGIALFASGIFNNIGGNPITGIAKWNGLSWSPLGPGIGGRVTGLATFDDGTGPALYAAGNFTQIGGSPMAAIARWDGTNWSPLGGGLTQNSGAAAGFVLTVFDPGSGPSLYVGGVFEFAGGQPARKLARWDGTNWHAAGDVIGPGFSGGSVNRMVVWDDGLGPALYIGGNITTVAGVPASGIARFRDGVWSSLGDGVTGGLERVNAMKVHNLGVPGSQSFLYIGGDFTSAGGIPTNNIARWDGELWEAMPGGGTNGGISVLEVFDDGEGPALFAGGNFTMAGLTTVSSIARWHNDQWFDLAGGVLHPSVTTVTALLVHDDAQGNGPALHIGGGFATAGSEPASSLARWACSPVCYANCDGSTTQPILNVDDFTCFINEFAAALTLPHEQQVSHYVNCDNSTNAPALNVDDFTCFINAFAAGCP